MPRTRRLVLVGGGATNVELLRAAARHPFGGDVVLVAPSATLDIAARVAEAVRGSTPEAGRTVDLRALCTEANARFVEAAPVRIDAVLDGIVVHTPGEPVTGDACALDLEPGVLGSGLSGVAEHAYPVRPQHRWRGFLRLLGEMTRAGTGAPVSCAVVGGGSTGVQVALAIVARGKAAGQAVACTLVTDDDAVLADLGPRAGARAAAILGAQGVRVVRGAAVTAVEADRILLADGSSIASALTVWATGATAPGLMRESGLPVDSEGFLRVDASLRAVTGVPVFGASDVVTMVESHAVGGQGHYGRHYGHADAPVLAANLRAVLHSPPREPRLFESASRFTLLDTSDGRALLYWRGWSHHSALAARLKQRLDARYAERFRVRLPPE